MMADRVDLESILPVFPFVLNGILERQTVGLQQEIVSLQYGCAITAKSGKMVRLCLQLKYPDRQAGQVTGKNLN